MVAQGSLQLIQNMIKTQHKSQNDSLTTVFFSKPAVSKLWPTALWDYPSRHGTVPVRPYHHTALHKVPGKEPSGVTGSRSDCLAQGCDEWWLQCRKR